MPKSPPAGDTLPSPPLYRPRDAGEAQPDPGTYPYTRGIYPTMYRGRLWTMRQYAGFSSAGETNRRFRYLLDQGVMGLSTAFDLPTQLGLDSDDPRAEGEVGKVGVAIDTVDDMARLFDGIPLGEVSTSMTINAPASLLLLMYELAGEEQGVAPTQLSGTIQNDILKEYAARGTVYFSAAAVNAPGDRYVRLLPRAYPALEHNQHQRVSYTRGRRHGDAGTGTDAGRRHCVCAGGDRGGSRG